ncbi:MAG: hypothetical protein IPF99_28635 [Deltaproteobacteria bacterium]|nr:hypothetical protein [Deltaproteobacteria bacterium]
MKVHRSVMLLLLVLSAGCASRGGYAEPGPASASANPPSPSSVQSGQPLQPSPGTGRQSEIPPMVGPLGNNLPPNPGRDQNSQPSCRTDADCVPDACCHPAACTARANAPSCAGTMCTMNCAPGTLDCGQARCVCLGGRCGVQRAG